MKAFLKIPEIKNELKESTDNGPDSNNAYEHG